MLKKVFFMIGLLTTAITYGNDDLMEIKSGIREAHKLLNPKNGRAPLQRHLNSAQFILEETMDSFTAYKTTNPLDAENVSLCIALNKLKAQLLSGGHNRRDDRKVFVS